MAKQKIGPWQDAWLRTLESGRFKQARAALCRKCAEGGLGFCCLGLACEVALENNIRMQVKEDSLGFIYNGNTNWLPEKVKNLLGFYSSTGGFNTNYTRRKIINNYIHAELGGLEMVTFKSLADMNDSHFTFQEIAKFCRKFPDVVFTEPR